MIRKGWYYKDIWTKFWKLKMHERLKVHFWRVATYLIPTKDKLTRTEQQADACCLFCGESREIAWHLFQSCDVAKLIWYNSKWCIRIDNLQMKNFTQLVLSLIEPLPQGFPLNGINKKLNLCFSSIVLDHLWRLRNQVVFQNEGINYKK